MRQKSIGEVLQTTREIRGWSLLHVQQMTRIQAKYLQALEYNDFTQIPDENYRQSFLKRYAEVLSLDADVLLDAYQNNRLVVFYEAGEEAVFGKEFRRSQMSSKRHQNYLPLVYLLLSSCFILAFVTYIVHSRIQNQAQKTTPSSYQVVSSESQSEEEETSSSSTDMSTSSSVPARALTVTGSGNQLIVNIAAGEGSIPLTLSVTDTTSWISVSDTELAGGVVLSPENKKVTTNLTAGVTQTNLVLGVVQGVDVSIADQRVDTSALTSIPATITIIQE